MSYRKINNNYKTQKNKAWYTEQTKPIWIFPGDLFLISMSSWFFFMILVCGFQALFCIIFFVVLWFLIFL
jgi:hypothetical protein